MRLRAEEAPGNKQPEKAPNMICPICNAPIPTSVKSTFECSCGAVLKIPSLPTDTNPYASPAQPVLSEQNSQIDAAGQLITPQEFSQLGLCRVGLLLIIIALVTSLLSVSVLAILSSAQVPMDSARGTLAIIGLLYLASAGLTLIGQGFLMAAPLASGSKGLFQIGFALTIIGSASPFLMEALETNRAISLLSSFVLTVMGISATFIHLTGLARLTDFVQPHGLSSKFT